eukprot:gene4181-4737_t
MSENQDIRQAVTRINELASEGERLLAALQAAHLPRVQQGSDNNFLSTNGVDSGTPTNGVSRPTTATSASTTVAESLRNLFPTFRNGGSQHRRTSSQRQTTIPYPRTVMPNRGRAATSGSQRRSSTARRESQNIVNKTLVIIPDPTETTVPTHRRRAALCLEGLVVDEFPFDKRWDDNELLLNVMDQLPLRLAMYGIRFVKASYGAIAPINLANGIRLSGERLLRIAGQGAVYAQVVPRESDPSNATSTESNSAYANEELASSSSSVNMGEEECEQEICSSFSMQTPSDDGVCVESAPVDPNEIARGIWSAIRPIFPNMSEEVLQKCVEGCTTAESAVDAVLSCELSIDTVMKQMTQSVNWESSVQITVRRESIWRDCLNFYKIAMVDKSRLFKELKVEFQGEDGVDCGALRLEFFQVCIREAAKVLLEETGDTMIPKKTTASLLGFKALGTLVGHSIIQGGPGIHHFPEWVYKFLCTGDFCSAAELLYSEKQIPLNAATALLHSFIEDIRKADTREKLEILLDESTSTGQVNSQIVNGSSWDITKSIDVESRNELISELIIDELLRKRIMQLTALREGLDISGVLRQMTLQPDLLKELFTPAKHVTAENILASLESPSFETGSKQEMVFSWFLKYIHAASCEKLAKLLQFATSLNAIPPAGLYPKIEINFHIADNKFYPESCCLFPTTVVACMP